MAGIKKLSMTIVGSAVLAMGTGNAVEASTIFTNPANEHKYFLTTPDTWAGAQNQAVAAGGNLVTINDAAEEAWLVSTFGSSLWIGLTDSELYEASEGNFKWVSGQPVTYMNWMPGEPNNYPHVTEGEDFVQLAGNPVTWADTTTYLLDMPPNFASGIVEIEPASKSVPEPSSALGLLAFGTFGVSSLLKRKQQKNILDSRFS